MEIITPQPPPPPKPARRKPEPRNLYLGLLFLVGGLVWLLSNLDVIGPRFFDLFFSWQTLIIALGVYLITVRKWAIGVLLTAFGAFLMVARILGLHLEIEKIVLPVLAIGIGLALLLPRR